MEPWPRFKEKSKATKLQRKMLLHYHIDPLRNKSLRTSWHRSSVLDFLSVDVWLLPPGNAAGDACAGVHCNICLCALAQLLRRCRPPEPRKITAALSFHFQMFNVLLYQHCHSFFKTLCHCSRNKQRHKASDFLVLQSCTVEQIHPSFWGLVWAVRILWHLGLAALPVACHWRFSSPLWSSDALTQRKVSLGIGISGEFFL